MRASLQEAIRIVQEYGQSDSIYPYFVCVDGREDYSALRNAIPVDYKCIRTSAYCGDDSFPDYDRLIDDISASSENLVVLGLGECSYLSGEKSIFTMLKDMLRSQKTIIICRNCSDTIQRLEHSDPKFTENRWLSVQSSADFWVTRVNAELAIDAMKGFKVLLSALENGVSGKQYVITAMSLSNASHVRSAYEAIKDKTPSFPVEESCLPQSCWVEYLTNPNVQSTSLSDWRFYLNILIYGTNSPYLQLVLRYSSSYDDYKKQLYAALLKVEWDTHAFCSLYSERKKLLKDFSEIDIEQYIVLSRERGKDRVHYLTDNTKQERRAIIEEISRNHEIPKNIAEIYPRLAAYLTVYHFSCANGDLFTDYFSHYKNEKLLNHLSESFLNTVSELAMPRNRKYNALQTRNAVLRTMFSANNVPALYWLDALGVEYLGFIQQLACELGLDISIQIARTSLPSCTSRNRDFYDDWQGAKVAANKHLDNLKHEGCEKRATAEDGHSVLPTHLADELCVIENVLLEIRGILNRGTDTVILASDHGASRLAVLNNRNNQWTMSEKGKHSGRCCPVSEVDEAPESATQEADERGREFWVLANYDRFKGGRGAAVEVHGGASLEEVVIPIIRIKLIESKTECHIVWNKEGTPIIDVNVDGDAEIKIFCSKEISALRAFINGFEQSVVPFDESMHLFVVKAVGLRRNGYSEVGIYNGDNLLCELPFIVQKQRKASKKDRDGTEFFG